MTPEQVSDETVSAFDTACDRMPGLIPSVAQIREAIAAAIDFANDGVDEIREKLMLRAVFGAMRGE